MTKNEKLKTFITATKGGIIISCQSSLGDPTHSPEFMVAFAESALRGLRVNGVEDIQAIRKRVDLPIIGIWKRPGLDAHGILITPTFDDACRLVEAGADLIALDTTARVRPNQENVAEIVTRIQTELHTPVMADCHVFEVSVRTGADIAAPTLSLDDTSDEYTPDFPLIEELLRRQKRPVIAEGRFWNPDDVIHAFTLGVHAVVIGSAVTRPWLITERYVRASLKNRSREA